MTEPADALPPLDSLAVAGVVHDVNQMLAVISGRAGLLLSQAEDAAAKPHLEAILLASTDAAAMLRRLSSPAGETVTGAGADLRQVAEQARLLVWPDAADTYGWSNDIGPGLGTGVSAQILREVLANLLLNALAVMPERGQVQVATRRLGPERVELLVKDSGPGLPAGDPEQVFARGYTGSGESHRGLGLAGCRQLLTAAGGRLRAEAGTAGDGATFVLELPVGEAVKPSPTPAGDVPPMDVLVVDDEAVVRNMLSDVLSAWGCRVLSFVDGQSALAAYREGSAAVALIDRNLPGLDGLELASRLRASDSCLSITMMTGWQRADAVAPVDPAVIDQEAEKPLAVERLKEILVAGHELFKARQDRRS